MSKVLQIINQVKEAQKKFATFTQEQVDKIFYQAAWAANDARITLAKFAVEETKMGVVEDKIIKNHFASEYIYNKYKNMKSVGVFEHDDALGYEKSYEPMGVIAAVIPTTNPTSTAIFKTLLALKTRNGIVISPHPRARKSTIMAAKIVLDAAVAAGAPEGIISWLPEDAKMEDTTELMKEADIILATGGHGLVKAAYSSGTPAIGVGSGNCPAIIDSTADIPMAIASIIQSNTFDNGVVCATENAVIVLKDIYEQTVNEIKKQGAYVVTNQSDIDTIAKNMLTPAGLIHPDLVGQNPQRVGQVLGVAVPEWAKMLFVETVDSSPANPLSHEKLSTFVALYKADDFDHALKIQSDLLVMGAGHSASLFVNEFAEREKVAKFRETATAARLLVNVPSALGAIGDVYNFHLEPSLTLGCGSWGNNIFSENIQPKHLLNVKEISIRRENTLWLRLPKSTYFKYGCLQEALKDLKTEGSKRALIVTDQFIWDNMRRKLVESLESLGIAYTAFTEVEPNPQKATVERCVKLAKTFKPDVIIAFGGGSSMDAAKLTWVWNEHPDVSFQDLALRFMDIRKKIVDFPIQSKTVKLVCIPTTAGTGSEVTPFAIISDGHTKWSLADYSLTPTMAIVDAEYMMSMPPRATAATGMDCLSHAIESYVSIFASEFTKPYSLEAIRLVFKYLVRAYKNGKNDLEARQGMAHAATIAGIAFANGFLGIVHSLSHKITAHHGVVHGNANAIYLPYVINYNAQWGVKEKQGYFAQYRTHDALKRYAEIADFLGLPGENKMEKVDNLIKAIQVLQKQIEVPTSTLEYGVDSTKFEAELEIMAEEAFDDQCTGGNPRYPLISEMRDIFVAAHYGNPIPKLADVSLGKVKPIDTTRK